ncbi:MAG: hypothetical protein ACLS48_08800 [[Eubacterium] siraeum]
MFQRTYLFSDTITNNICFGKPDATLEEVKAAAKKARCYDFIMSKPMDLTRSSVRAVTLWAENGNEFPLPVRL